MFQLSVSCLFDCLNNVIGRVCLGVARDLPMQCIVVRAAARRLCVCGFVLQINLLFPLFQNNWSRYFKTVPRHFFRFYHQCTSICVVYRFIYKIHITKFIFRECLVICRQILYGQICQIFYTCNPIDSCSTNQMYRNLTDLVPNNLSTDK
jgi:hypothetical protein